MVKVFIVLAKLSSMQQNLTWGCRLAWSRLVDLGSIDSGSNPGSPTTRISLILAISVWLSDPYFNSAFYPYSCFSLHQIDLRLDRPVVLVVEFFS